MKHTEYLELLLELSKHIDMLGKNYGCTSPAWQKASCVMDAILSHHFSTEETEAMRLEDIAADGGGK